MSSDCAMVFIRGCTFLLMLAFPIAEITMGVVYLDECPASPLIPVYVMVCGIMAILLIGLIALAMCHDVSENLIWIGCLLTLCIFLLIWLCYGSYIVYSINPPNYIKNSNSSVLNVSAADHKPEPYNQTQNLQSLNQTGTIYQSNQTLLSLIQTLSRNSSALDTSLPVEAAAPYCNRNLYKFAFWMTTVVWSISALLTGSAGSSRQRRRRAFEINSFSIRGHVQDNLF